jgi:hypothetical protein
MRNENDAIFCSFLLTVHIHCCPRLLQFTVHSRPDVKLLSVFWIKSHTGKNIIIFDLAEVIMQSILSSLNDSIKHNYVWICGNRNFIFQSRYIHR